MFAPNAVEGPAVACSCSSFWRTPTSRHSGAARISVFCRCLFLLVILSVAKNPRISSLPVLACHSERSPNESSFWRSQNLCISSLSVLCPNHQNSVILSGVWHVVCAKRSRRACPERSRRNLRLLVLRRHSGAARISVFCRCLFLLVILSVAKNPRICRCLLFCLSFRSAAEESAVAFAGCHTSRFWVVP